MAWRDFSDGSGDDGPSNQSGSGGYVDTISTSMRSLVDARLVDEEVKLQEGYVDAISSSMRSLADEEVRLPPGHVDAMTTSMRSLAEEEVRLPPGTSNRPRRIERRRNSDGEGSSYIDTMVSSFRCLVDEEVKGEETVGTSQSPNSSDEVPTHQSATMTSSVVNLLNTLAGAGMLGLPGAFAKSGFAGGSIFLVASCFFSAIGLRLLAVSAETTGVHRDRPSSFFSVSSAALPRFTVVIDVAVVLKCFGVAVSYFVTVGDSMVDASRYLLRDFAKKGHFFEAALTSKYFWISVACAAVTPICFHRTLDSLKFVSALSIQLKIALVVGVVLYAEGVFDPCGEESVTSNVGQEDSTILTEPDETTSSGDDYGDCRGETEVFTDFESTFSGLAIFVFAFSCHQNIFPVLNEMKYRTQARLDRVIYFSTGCALLLYAVVAVEGYRTYGSNVQGDILLSYPQTALLTAMRIFVAATVILSYPLQLDPCRRCISSLICEWKRSGRHTGPNDANTSMASLADEISLSEQEIEKLRSPDDNLKAIEGGIASEKKDGSGLSKGNIVWLSVSDKEAAEGIDKYSQNDECISSCEFIATTLIVLTLSFVAAMVVTDLGVVLMIVGATGSTVLTFILPGAIYLQLHPKLTCLRFLAYVQLLLGMVILPTCLYLVISRSAAGV